MILILVSRIWAALVAIILVPVYVKIIGVESYGLVAFYSTLAGALAILDLGLSASISRQVAILKTQHGKEKELNDLVFSVETLNWLIAVIVGSLILYYHIPLQHIG
ncbi:MAG: oligosaccharide flippase family protein [Chitinophagaceae bacterium]|nr:oligosaccharide flippase family protein [Chitinophagaceae bacterium]